MMPSELTPSAHPFFTLGVLLNLPTRHPSSAQQSRQNDHIRCLSQTFAGAEITDKRPTAGAPPSRSWILIHRASELPGGQYSPDHVASCRRSFVESDGLPIRRHEPFALAGATAARPSAIVT